MIYARSQQKGLTLIEVMVVVSIFTILIIGLYSALGSGRNAWFDTDASIDLQQNIRRTLSRVTKELRESSPGIDTFSEPYVNIQDGAGINSTDVLEFRIPIICEEDISVINQDTEIAHWGAPLSWGCSSYECMDADASCATLDYKYIRYLIDENNQLLRRIIRPDGTEVREDVFADNIIGFQVNSNNPSPNNTIITVAIEASKKSVVGRLIEAFASVDVQLRNRG